MNSQRNSSFANVLDLSNKSKMKKIISSDDAQFTLRISGLPKQNEAKEKTIGPRCPFNQAGLATEPQVY
jgi:hypothetical protein